jgi:catechol 2,3-dioxygenase-like lactoylglutathione lyase family enzyme
VFDHVGIAVSEVAASERFYRTVLSVEPSHADAELVEWDDWDIGATDPEHPVTRGSHSGFRARDRAGLRRFYTTIAPHAGLRLTHDEPERVQLSGPDCSFSLLRDERPLTEHVHLAFPARDDAPVRAFHAAALAAGDEDHGEPGERAVYHPGYYGAFVLDPAQRRGRQSQPGLSARQIAGPHSGRSAPAGDIPGHWPTRVA